MDSNFIWGILILVCGVFIASYGDKLFRFSLAFLGFALGISLVMWLGDALGTSMQILVGIVAGGILAMVFYFMVNFSLYIAGGVVGLVLMMAVLALFRLSGLNLGIVGTILVVAASGAGVVFGRRMGDLIVVFATSLAGAYLIVLGLSALFTVGDAENPLSTLGSAFPLVLFAAVFAVSFLTQQQAFSVRQRFLRRP